MKRHAFHALALLSCLSCPSAIVAGTIDYEFADTHWPHRGIARMVVDDGALARGVIANADVLSLAFPPFGVPDLLAFAIPISATDGTPTGEGTIAAARDIGGTTYSLTVDFGPGSFNPISGGFYQVSGGGTPGTYGYGYWTATLDATPAPGAASVPEPASVVLACLGLAWGFVTKARRS